MHTARIHTLPLFGYDATLASNIHTMKLSEALTQLGRPVVFYPKLAAIFGGMQEAIFIAQLTYWTGKQSNKDGWIYKSVEEIEQETGLTYEQQRRVRKTLLGSPHDAKGRFIRTALVEPVLLERYGRTEHKMYFKIDLEALDRAASQGQLFAVEAPGQCPGASWTMSKSSTTESTTESTLTHARQKRAHSQFVHWWGKMVKETRGKECLLTAADVRNLKIALQRVGVDRLEQFGLFFLCDRYFREYQPHLRVFLSHGVFKGLSRLERREGFWRKVEGYMRKHGVEKTRDGTPNVRELLATLTAQFAVKTIREEA